MYQNLNPTLVRNLIIGGSCFIVICIIGLYIYWEDTTIQSNRYSLPVQEKTTTQPDPKIDEAIIDTSQESHIYSPTDEFVGINLNDTISVRGEIKNVRRTSHGVVTFTLHKSDKFILCSADTHHSQYFNGNIMTITGKYMTTKALELLLNTEISDTNIPVIWIDNESAPKHESEITSEQPLVKELNWTKTPAEQELKVGDWVTVNGWQNTFIGASLNDQTNMLEYQTTGDVDLNPKSTGWEYPDVRINGFFVTIKEPYIDKTIVLFNKELLRKKNSSDSEASMLIGVTAKITAILEDVRYPNEKWMVFCQSNSKVYIEYPAE